MIQKIKNYFLNKKLVLICLFLLLLVGLFFPFQKAKADLLGIIDSLNSILEGVEEQAAPLANTLITVFKTYIIGLILLYTSANFLQMAINGQEAWISLKTSAVVQSGWHFIAGLSNLFLILIFVIIAIAYILKLETFQAKKALPKLIIVALLMNFSLVFIGMLLDVSNILYRTILSGNQNLIIQFIDALGIGGQNLYINLGIWLGLLIVLWANPLGGLFQLAFVLLMLAITGPNLIVWTFQIVLFFLISGVFFTYTFIFAARVFMIWFLAMLSPLAFICMILPQTQKYWKEWVQHLFSWIFTGLFLLLFMALGIRAAPQMAPPGGLTPFGILSIGSIAGYIAYYFFMMIFLILVLWVSKQFMPTIAAFIIAQATAMGTMAVQRVGKPLARGLQAQTRKSLAESPGIQKWAQRQAMAEKGWGPGFMGRATGQLRRGFGRAIGPGIIEAEKRALAKQESEAEKIKDPSLMYSKFRDAMAQRNDTTALAYYNQAIKKKGGFKKLFEKEENVTDDDAVALGRYANKIKAVPEAERIARGHINRARDMGFEALTPEELRKYGTLERKIMGTVKGDEVKELPMKKILEAHTRHEAWADEALDSMREFWGGPQFRQAAEEFERDFVDAFVEPLKTEMSRIKQLWRTATPAQKDALDLRFRQDIKVNPRLSLYLSTTAAQEFGYESLFDMAPDELRRKYGNIRRALAEP